MSDQPICPVCGKPALQISNGIAIHQRTQGGLIATYHTVLTLEEVRDLQEKAAQAKKFKYHMARIVLSAGLKRYNLNYEIFRGGELFSSVAECEHIIEGGL